MVKRRNSTDVYQAAVTAGSAIEQQDRQLEARAIRSQMASLPLQKIIERQAATRELNSQHVVDLMASIAVLGLLEPLVVDVRGRLLAGGHRQAAIELLKEQMPEEYDRHFPDDMVPVRSLDFDADREPELALNVEVAENEKRRDYTRAEVKQLAEKLKAAGYADPKGRPATGERALRPALEIIIGKSQRTVRRYLNEAEDKKSGSGDLLSPETIAITSLRNSLSKWQKAYGNEDRPILEPIDREVAKLLKKLDAALKKSRQQDLAQMFVVEEAIDIEATVVE
jgi:ParB family transcriptional regulator, chromosome partitioning protein